MRDYIPKSHRGFLGFFILVIAASFLGGCTRKPEATPSGEKQEARSQEIPRGGTLRLAGREDVRSLDPAIGYDTISVIFLRILYNGLVDYDEGTNIAPDIAKKWETSPDGKIYRFEIRQGVRFSGGREVTAEDFRYSFERVLNPKTLSPGSRFFNCLEGADAFIKGQADHVSGIVAEDPHHLILKLKEPVPYFLNILAMGFGLVVPIEAVEQYGKEFGRHPQGTGPFVLEEWQSGQRIVLKRNPEHFRPEWPRTDRIEYLAKVQDHLALMKLEKGEIDLFGDLSYIPSADYVRLSQDPRWKPRLVSSPQAATLFLQLNCEMPPFDNVKVRQALAYAINRERIIQLFNGRGLLAKGMLPPGIPGYNENLKGFPYDPAKARLLLKEAGFEKGLDIEIWTLTDETVVKMYQSVQSDLAEVGIRVKLKSVSFTALLEATGRPGQVAIYGSGWFQDYPDPMNFLEVNFHSREIAPVDSNNRSYYRNPEVDALFDKAARTPSGPDRWALYQKAEKIIVSDAPCVFLYHPVTVAALNPRVKGYAYHPVWITRYDRIGVE